MSDAHEGRPPERVVITAPMTRRAAEALELRIRRLARHHGIEIARITTEKAEEPET